MTPSRTFLLSLGLTLTVGFCLGRLTADLPARASAAGKAAASVPDTTPAASRAANASTPAPAAPAPAVSAADPVQSRLAGLLWMKQNKILVRPPMLDRNGSLASEFVALFGINETQAAHLNAVLAHAKLQLDELTSANSSSRVGPDGKTLIVEVPSLAPQVSGPIYDRLLASMKNELGAERFAVFDEILGDQLDTAFDRFGLNATRYEVTPREGKQFGGKIGFDYKRHYVDAGGSSSGWTGGSLSAADLVKNFPVLKAHVQRSP